jgi:hypothetical protein
MEANHLYVDATLCVLVDKNVKPSASIKLHQT